MEPKKHLHWLDWMRFLAAFMVTVCHARGYNWVEWGSLAKSDQTPLTKLFFASTRAGLEWVVVFFVLSGFLVGGGVISRCLKGTFDIRLFAVDRTTRIFVPLIPALFLSLGIARYCGIPSSIMDMLGNAAALQGVFFESFAQNAPLWSLSYEVWFYIIIGALGALLTCGLKHQLASFLTLLVAFAVFTKLNAVLLGCWLLGSFCYFLTLENKKHAVFFLALFLSLLGGAISQLHSETISVATNPITRFLPSQSVAWLVESVGIGIMIASIRRIQPKSPVMISIDKMGTSLAAFSYTLYLTHYPILHVWEHFIPLRSPSFSFLSLVIFVSKIASCLLVGWLFYLPFEAKTPIVRKWLRKAFLKGDHDRYPDVLKS